MHSPITMDLGFPNSSDNTSQRSSIGVLPIGGSSNTAQLYWMLFVGTLVATWAMNLLLVALLSAYLRPDSKTLEGIRRLSRDLSLTPVRMALVGINFFCLQKFMCLQPIGRVEYERTQMSWVILSAGYASEMVGYAGEAGGTSGSGTCASGGGSHYGISLLHHVLVMAITALVNKGMPYSAAVGVRHWLRLLSGVVVFAVGMGGMLTSFLRILYFFRKASTRTSTSTRGDRPSAATCWTAWALTWALTGTTTCAWWEIIWRYHVCSDAMFGIMGPRMAGPSLCTAYFFFYVQWKWVLLWHAKADKLWQAGAANKTEKEHGTVAVAPSSTKFRLLPVLCVCGGTLAGLVSMTFIICQSVVMQLSSVPVS